MGRRAATWARIARLGTGLALLGLFLACTMPEYAFSTAPVEPEPEDSGNAAQRDAASTPEDSASPPVDAGLVEMDAEAAAPTTCFDGGGALVMEGQTARCFFFTEVVVPCNNACSPNGRLATFPDVATLDKVVAAIEPLRRARRYWIGLRSRNGPTTKKADFAWGPTAEPLTFDKWVPGRPSAQGVCVIQDALDGDGNNKPPAWTDHAAAEEWIALCERDP